MEILPANLLVLPTVQGIRLLHQMSLVSYSREENLFLFVECRGCQKDVEDVDQLDRPSNSVLEQANFEELHN